jgi:hypothetical protein
MPDPYSLTLWIIIRFWPGRRAYTRATACLQGKDGPKPTRNSA